MAMEWRMGNYQKVCKRKFSTTREKSLFGTGRFQITAAIDSLLIVLPQLREVESLEVGLNDVSCVGASMPPAYDLIYLRDGEIKTKTVQVADAKEAWRLGREQYPDCMRGVVCHEQAPAPALDHG